MSRSIAWALNVNLDKLFKCRTCGNMFETHTEYLSHCFKKHGVEAQ